MEKRVIRRKKDANEAKVTSKKERRLRIEEKRNRLSKEMKRHRIKRNVKEGKK